MKVRAHELKANDIIGVGVEENLQRLRVLSAEHQQYASKLRLASMTNPDGFTVTWGHYDKVELLERPNGMPNEWARTIEREGITVRNNRELIKVLVDIDVEYGGCLVYATRLGADNQIDRVSVSVLKDAEGDTPVVVLTTVGQHKKEEDATE